MTKNNVAKTPLRGVNFGGWLIAEKWLTPALFDGTDADDEFTLSKTSSGRKKITQHRNTFITEKDFEWCRDHGIALVRLPVGYWLTDDSDYVPCQKWIDQAVTWAEEYGIQLIIDLHAVPGGQNGEVHSGRIGEIKWHTDETFANATITALELLVRRYGSSAQVWGFELMNEPSATIDAALLKSFYQRAYDQLVPLISDDTSIIFHDSFRPKTLNGSIRFHGATVVMDIHRYTFDIPVHLPLRMFLWVNELRTRMLIRWLQRKQPVIVGEWSSVLPQLYFDTTSKELHDALLAKNIASQRRAYAGAVAEIYWNYKAEGRGMWNYRALVEDGIIN